MGSVTKEDRETMFLMEVLVDHLTIDNNKLNFAQETLKYLGEACVMFQFLNYPPLVVCHEDFGKRTSHYGATTDIQFNSGKSCLFSVRSQQMHPISELFQIQVSVIRRIMSRNGSTGKKTIATTKIDLGEDFAALMRRSRISLDSSAPLFQAKGDTYALQSLDGRVVGEIKVFLRLSCFGQYIVTQFSLGDKENQAYLFKGTEHSQISKIPGDKTKRPIPQIDTSRPCPPPPPPASHVPGANQDRRYETGSVISREPSARPSLPVYKPYDRDSTRLSKELPSHDMPPDVQREPGKKQPDQPVPGPRPLIPQPRPAPVPTDPDGNYKEITAEVKGHTIRIRVPRSKKDGASKQPDGHGPVCTYAPKLNVCDCNYPIPPGLIPRCPVPQQPPNCGCR